MVFQHGVQTSVQEHLTVVVCINNYDNKKLYASMLLLCQNDNLILANRGRLQTS